MKKGFEPFQFICFAGGQNSEVLSRASGIIFPEPGEFRELHLVDETCNIAENSEQNGKLEPHDKKRHQRDDRLSADNEIPLRGGKCGQEKTGKKSGDSAGQGKIADLALFQIQCIGYFMAGNGTVNPTQGPG